MAKPKPADFKSQAQMFKALAHPARLLMLDELSRGERCVCELQADLGAAQSRLSFHLKKLKEAGVDLIVGEGSIGVKANGKIKSVDLTTLPYPGFPTDMQAQWIALMSLAGGTSVVTDTIYFDRFKHVPELMRLGADISVSENSAVVKGVAQLEGAKVMSTDLRASASLVLAGLAAKGTTEVLRVYHLDRGYQRIEEKLKSLGAHIKRIESKDY